MAKRIAAILFVVIGILATLEFAFRQGVWEPLAKPGSYAGQSIMIKNAVSALGTNQVDFITIGDSLVGSGLDHERVAAAAKVRGFTHVHVGSGGMHWMSTDFMIRWVKQQSPKLRNVVIATSVSNYQYAGNGSYELAIAAPVARPWNSAWMAESVKFDAGDLRTFGVYSALFQYRDDLRDFVGSPLQRFRDIEWSKKNGLNEKIITYPYPAARNLCRVPLASLESCASFSVTNPEDQNLVSQCVHEYAKERARADYTDYATPNAEARFGPLRELRRRQIRDLPLAADARPILVVLMPVAKVFRESVLPKGIEEWTRFVLKPLEEEGLIEVHDFTRLFDGDASIAIDCSAFHDLYHLNSVGQKVITDKLLPIFESRLYRGQPSGKSPSPKR